MVKQQTEIFCCTTKIEFRKNDPADVFLTTLVMGAWQVKAG